MGRKWRDDPTKLLEILRASDFLHLRVIRLRMLNGQSVRENQPWSANQPPFSDPRSLEMRNRTRQRRENAPQPHLERESLTLTQPLREQEIQPAFPGWCNVPRSSLMKEWALSLRLLLKKMLFSLPICLKKGTINAGPTGFSLAHSWNIIAWDFAKINPDTWLWCINRHNFSIRNTERLVPFGGCARIIIVFIVIIIMRWILEKIPSTITW